LRWHKVAVPSVENPHTLVLNFPHYFPSHASDSPYRSDMDYEENAQERQENHWRAELQGAEVGYSEDPCIETRAAYRSVLKTFADLVLRGEAPDEAPTH